MVGAYSEGGEGILELAGCLSDAAENDLEGGVRLQHGDGWGLAVLTEDGLIIYRSGRPIYEERPDVLSLLRGKRTLVIIHARLASEKSKVGPQYSHPYLATSMDGSLTYILAHNGSVRKRPLVDDEDLLPPGLTSDEYVDSELIALYLAKWGLSGESLSRLQKYVTPGSAVNLLVIEISRSRRIAALQAYSHWDAAANGEYYRLYKVEAGGTRAIVSSTVARECKRRGWEEISALEAGRIESVGELRLVG
ncbi:MAG: class II glutamine amidotransferase [Acidilobus sp.]